MLRALLRDLLAHRARVLMTLVAIMLGSASVVVSWTVADSVAASLAHRDLRTEVGVVAQAKSRPLGEADYRRLSALPGVTKAIGVRTGRAALVDGGGKLVPTKTPLEATGSGWDDSGRFKLAAGRAPARSGEIAVAVDAGRLGSRARILLSGGRWDHALVVGTFVYRSIGTEADQAPQVGYDPATAAERLGPGYDRIEFHGVSAAAIVRAAPGASVTSGADLLTAAGDKVASDAADLREVLLPFAAVALLVGLFVIANTFTMLGAQRIRQFALLRAVGAQRRQIRRTVLLEAAVLGVVGGTLGVVAGIAAGPALLAVMRPDDKLPLVVGPTGILLGYAVAVVVTVLAAYASARRAATVPPVAALRTDAVAPRHVSRRRTSAGLAVIALALVMIVATAAPNADDLARIVALAGCAVLAVGVVLIAPALAAVVLRPIVGLSRRFGPATRLGVASAAGNPGRTASTGTAITVGVGLVCAFATLSATFATLIGSTTRANLPATTTVVQPFTGSHLSGADLGRIRALPSVTAVSAARNLVADIHYAGGTAVRSITVIDPNAFGKLLTPRITAGSGRLEGGAVIAENQADILRIKVGDTLSFQTDGATVRTRVAGVYDATEMSASVYVDAAIAPMATEITQIYATGPDPAAAQQAVSTAFKGRPDITVTDREGVIAQGVENQRVGFLVMDAMFGLAILIAAFGVVNTLALSTMERTREIGVLRAVGATRTLIRRSIRQESLVISGFGGLLGVTLGLAVGTVMQHAMLGQPIGSPTVPLPTVVIVFVGGALVALLAAFWPARLASRTDVLAAIATD